MEEAFISNLLVQCNASFTKAYIIEGGTDPTYTPLNLTGCVAKAVIKRSHEYETPVVTFTTAIDGPAGEITVSLSPVITATLSPNIRKFRVPDDYEKLSLDALPGTPYVWELLLKDTSNYVYRIAEGGVLVLPGLQQI